MLLAAEPRQPNHQLHMLLAAEPRQIHHQLHMSLAAEPRQIHMGANVLSGADRGWRGRRQIGKMTSPATPAGQPKDTVEQETRRGNYESGADYVLEYGELRFSFNEDDFGQRVEQAAVKLEFVEQGLEPDELQDLVELAVNGEIREPTSELGEHIVECWTDLVGPANRSLVHWLRRLVFRGAWLDQRVKEGELDIVFDEETHTFGYVQPDRDSEPIELSREPSWGRVAYRPRA